MRRGITAVKVVAFCALALLAKPAYSFEAKVGLQGYLKSGSNGLNGTFDYRVVLLKNGTAVWAKDFFGQQITTGALSRQLSGLGDDLTSSGMGNYTNVSITTLFNATSTTDNFSANVIVDLDANGIGLGADATFTGISIVAVPLALSANNLAKMGAADGQYLVWDNSLGRWKPFTLVVNSSNITAGAVDQAAIGSGAVTASALANDAVTTIAIQDSAVVTSKIADDAITTLKLLDLNVTTTKLADSAVTTAKINDTAVTNSKIADDAVTTAKIIDGAVTAAKLAADAVGTVGIADGSVTTAKVADGAITNVKIANSTLDLTTKVTGVLPVANGGTNNGSLGTTAGGVLSTDGSKVTNVGAGATGQYLKSNAGSAPAWTTLTIADLHANGGGGFLTGAGSSSCGAGQALIYSHITDTISCQTIVVNSIAAGTITNADVSATAAIAYSKLALSNSIVTGDIVDANVTTNKIADSNVTTAKIADSNVTTIKINDQAVTNAKIADGTIDLTSKVTAALPLANGGTNNGSLTATAGGIMYGNGTKIMNTAAGSAGQYLKSNAASAPTWTTLSIADIRSTQSGSFLTGTTCAAGQALIYDQGTDTIYCAPVTAGGVAPGTITNAMVSATAAIDYSKLNLTGNIANSDVSNTAAIAYSKLNLANSIATGDIVNANVTNAKIADDAVTTTKILDANVTNGKLADGAVTNVKISDGTINLTTKVTDVLPIANGGTNNGSLSVTNGGLVATDGSKLINTGPGSSGQYMKSVGTGTPQWTTLSIADIRSTISGGFLQGSTCTPGQSLVYDLTSDSIYCSAVTAGSVANGTITNAMVNASAAIAYSKLNLANSIVAGDLTDSSVTTNKVADGAVTTIKLNDGAVTTIKINDGAVTSTKMAANAVDLSSSVVTSTLPIGRGGTNNPSLGTANGGVVASDGSKLVNTGAGASGQYLKSIGAGTPTWTTLGIADIKSTGGGNFLTGTTCGAGEALVYTAGGTDTIGCAPIQAGNVASGTITNAMVSNTAAIAYSKLNLASSIATGDLSNLAVTNAKIANGTIDLTAKVTGTLPIANGGTGSTDGSITGSSALTFAAGGSNQNVTLTPSGTGYTVLNGSVGVGTTSPGAKLDVKGTLKVSGTTSGGVIFQAPASGATGVYTLPSADGAGGNVLTTDGSGGLTWTAKTTGSVTNIATGSGLTGGPITSTGTISLATIANNTLLANTSGSTGVPTATSISSVLDGVSNTQGSVLYRSGAGWVALSPGTSGQFLQTQGASQNPQWASGNVGTVTNVAMTVPSFLSVSGSPISGTGTLAVSLATQTQNTIFAGPTTGAAAAPTFRTLVAADIPTIALTSGVSGVLPIANGGTNNGSLGTTAGGMTYGDGSKLMMTGAGVSGQFMKSAGSSAPAFASLNITDIKSSVSGNFLTGTSCGAGEALVYTAGGVDSMACAPITAGGVAAGTITNAMVNASAAIAYSKLNLSNSIVAGDITSGAIIASKMAASSVDLATSTVTGTLPVANGGTGSSTAFTQGSLVFAGASGTYSQNNSNLFWDNSSNRLGVGTASPGVAFDVNAQSALVRGTGTTPGEIRLGPGPTTGSNYVGFKGPASNPATSVLWQLPAADGSSGQFLKTNGSGALSFGAVDISTAAITGTLPVANGGTGATSITASRLVVGNGTSPLTVMAAGTAGQMLQSGGASAPAWSTSTFPTGAAAQYDLLYASAANTWSSLTKANTAALVTSSLGAPSWATGSANTVLKSDGTTVSFGAVDLSTAMVSNTLPITRGGTGATAFATGSVVFASSTTALSQSNANFFWDNSNSRLGLGTASPSGMLDISKALTVAASTTGKYLNVGGSTLTDSTTAASGTAPNNVFSAVGQPTLAATNTSVTTTNAYNMYIAGAPIKGTNNTATNAIALGIAAGAVGSQTNSYGLYVNAQTGATSGNYAAAFMGGNVGVGIAAPGANLDVKGTLKVSGSTSGGVTFQTAASGATGTYTLPSTDGTGGYVLTTDGSGGLTWTAKTTGSVTNVATGTGLTGGPISSTGTISLATIANNSVLANVSGSTAAPSATTVPALLDTVGNTHGQVLYRNGSTWTVLAPGTSGQFLQTQGASQNPQWASVPSTNLASGVTGTLPVGNGGTGTATQFTQGSVVFAGASGVYSQANSSLFWDNSSNRLGIGTASPGVALDVNAQTALIRGTGTTPGEVRFGPGPTTGSNYVGFKGPSSNPASSVVWQLPAADGSSGQVMSTNAAGVLSWTNSVSSVATGTGLTGGPITSTGTISLANIAANTLLANATGSSAAPTSTSISAVIDGAIGNTQGNILYRDGSAWTVLAPGTAGQVLQTGGAAANPSWTNASAGTLTSVAMSVPSFLSVSGSPVTGASGTLAVSLATQTAQTVLAGPTSGGAVAPTFRTLNIGDIKSTGGGAFLTGTSCAAGEALIYAGGTDTMYCAAITAGDIANGIVTNAKIAAATIDLTSKVTNTLPTANGGTGSNDGSITGAGPLTFAAGGTNQNVTLTPSGTGYTVLNGKIGIGTSSPASVSRMTVDNTVDDGSAANIRLRSSTTRYRADLYMKGSNGLNVTSYDDTGAAYLPILLAGSTFTVNTGATQAMLINSSGNVAIGTAAPATTLDVQGTTTTLASVEGASSSVNSGTSYTIPDITRNMRRITLTGDATITLPSISGLATDSAYSVTVRVTQDGTGSRTLTWAGNSGQSIKWDSGSAPTVASAASNDTIYQFMIVGGETTWYASQVWKEQ